MARIKPFSNDADVLGIDELTIENRADRVAIYGSLDITRDKAGLAKACQLKAVLDDVVRALEGNKSLPDEIALRPTRRVKNPFS